MHGSFGCRDDLRAYGTDHDNVLKHEIQGSKL